MNKNSRTNILKSFVSTIIFLLSMLFLLPVRSEGLSGFDCLIEPHSVAEVGTSEKGVVDKFMVDRGDRIKKGQVLARLESDMEEVAVELARAQAEKRASLEAKRRNVEYQTRQLNRIADLVSKKALPAQEKDQTATQLEIAKSQVKEEEENIRIAKMQLKRAEVALKERTIYSPINGVVMEQLLQPGELVEEQKPIIKIAEIVPLDVEVIIPVEHYGEIMVGMQAEVTPKISGVGPQIATVVAVDPVVDAASNTFGVQLELPNKDETIPGGIRCDINFDAVRAKTE